MIRAQLRGLRGRQDPPPRPGRGGAEADQVQEVCEIVFQAQKPFFRNLRFSPEAGLAIYDPTPLLDAKRRRLLFLLSKLLEDSLDDPDPSGNKPPHSVTLIESERLELLRLAIDLASDRSFIIAAAFVDGLSGRASLTDDQLREIYLSERKKRGRARALASMHWADFLTRLGRPNAPVYGLKMTTRMSFEHFRKMEERLFESLGFSRLVVDYLLRRISEAKSIVETARTPQGEPSTRGHPALKDAVNALSRIEEKLRDKLEGHTLSAAQVASITTILSNLSVLFTTRDWSVAGFMSVIAGEGIKALDKP